jgi:hypothetical protein
MDLARHVTTHARMLGLFVQDSLAGLRSLRSLISLIQLVSGRRALEMLVRRIEVGTCSGASTNY